MMPVIDELKDAQNLRALFNQLKSPLIFLNSNESIEEANTLAIKILQLNPKHYININLREFCQEKKLSLINLIDQDNRLLKGFEEAYKVKGKTYTIVWKMIRFSDHKLSDSYILFGEDITAYSLLAKEMKKKIFFYENILSKLPTNVYWKDRDCVYRGCNDRLARVTGLPSRESVNGMTDFDFNWGEGAAESFVAFDKKVMKTGKSLTTEDSFKEANGTFVTVLTNKTPLKNQSGKTVGVLAISVDITDRKRMEASLKKAKEKAEEASTLKDQFIQNMQHDLRTPATGLAGLLSQLVAGEGDPNRHQCLKLLHEAAEELLILIDSIVDFDRINYGEFPILEQKFNLVDILTTVDHLYQVGAKDKGLVFDIQVDPKLPKMFIGDAFRLQRILTNLVDNAIKFTDKGSVTLTANQAKAEGNKTIITFTVQDSGIGIPEDKQLLIYEKFTRLHPSNTGRYKGVGLGLSLVKKFVSELKGEIELVSQEGKGATFMVTLPFKEALVSDTMTPLYSPLASFHRKKDEERIAFSKSKKKERKKTTEKLAKESTPPKVNKEKTPSSQYRVLLVEDSPIAQMLGRQLLTEDKAEVVVTGNGKEALDAVKEKPFDLILMDLGLPHGEDGRDVTREIRSTLAKETTRRVPIIALTAHIDEAGKQTCLDAGMNAVYRKPLTEEKLTEIRSLFLMNKQKPQAKEANKEKTEEYTITGKVFDWDLAIERAGGNEESAKSLIPVVKQSLEEEAPKLQAAFDEKNWEELKRVAHKLRGGCAYTGVPRLQQACSYLEEYILSGKTEAIEKLYHQVIEEIKAVKEEISS